MGREQRASKCSGPRPNSAVEWAGRAILGDIVDMGKRMGTEGMWDRFVSCFARASGAVVEGEVARARAHRFGAPLVASLGIIRHTDLGNFYQLLVGRSLLTTVAAALPLLSFPAHCPPPADRPGCICAYRPAL